MPPRPLQRVKKQHNLNRHRRHPQNPPRPNEPPLFRRDATVRVVPLQRHQKVVEPPKYRHLVVLHNVLFKMQVVRRRAHKLQK